MVDQKNTPTTSNISGNVSGSTATKSTEQSKSTSTNQSSAQSSPTERGARKVRSGYVISNMMQKTIVVEVISRVRHPMYHKIVRRTRRFHAHDELNTANVGDLVTIIETRPLSKTKHFRLLEIVEKAK
jgi:small subunit ribosomal protein S17